MGVGNGATARLRRAPVQLTLERSNVLQPRWHGWCNLGGRLRHGAGRFAMTTYSLRKTPSHLHLAYKYGEAAGGVVGRNVQLTIDGHLLTLDIGLESNLRARNKSSSWYVSCTYLARNPHKLKSLQCPDNLVRARLIRAWEQVANPRLRMQLDVGELGRFLYDVSPHSLFTGGVQLDVRAFIQEGEESPQHLHATSNGANHYHRQHA